MHLRLRPEGFVVRDHEMDDLKATRCHWQVPDAVYGCHPARHQGYVLEGRVPANALRRLARERPAAAGVMRVDTAADTSVDEGSSAGPNLQFVLIDRDGTRRPGW